MILILLSGIVGAAAGGGAHMALARLGPEAVGEARPQASEAVPEGSWRFMPLGALLLPVTDVTGQFAGYATIEIAVELPADQEEAAKERIPIVIDAINRQVWRTPIGINAARRTLDLDALRRLALSSARATFGADAVRGVAITKVEPA